MQTRGLVVKASWIIVLALLCTRFGPSSRTNDAQGPDRKPPPRGSVFGVVFQPQEIYEGGKSHLDPKRGPWAFADGTIVPADGCGGSHPNKPNSIEPIRFKTDAQGRFRVDHVPVGRVAVNFERGGGDIISTYSRIAYVLDRQSTEVRFF